MQVAKFPADPPNRGRTDGKVFIYWDNSNIFARAKDTVAEREGAAMRARMRMRIDFEALARLAGAGRPVEKAVVAASVPPSPDEALWRQMAGTAGLEILEKFDRGHRFGKEQEVPDLRLQLRMMGDALDFWDSPGVAVLLTGDGRERDGEGFFRALKRMRRRGWRIELLAWQKGCHTKMRAWAEENGVFVPLDDYYESVTFLKASDGPGRPSAPLDLSRRPMAV